LTGSCKFGNKLSSSIKGREFLDLLSNYKFLRKDLLLVVLISYYWQEHHVGEVSVNKRKAKVSNESTPNDLLMRNMKNPSLQDFIPDKEEDKWYHTTKKWSQQRAHETLMQPN
jgi:hypothetical protein